MEGKSIMIVTIIVVMIAIISLWISSSDKKQDIISIMGTIIAMLVLPLSLVYLIDKFKGIKTDDYEQLNLIAE